MTCRFVFLSLLAFVLPVSADPTPPDVVTAERVPLRIEVSPELLEGLSAGAQAALRAEVARLEEGLFTLEEVRVAFPASLIPEGLREVPIGERYFQEPMLDELGELSHDPVTGERVELTEEQWTQIQERGLIVVPSREHPDANWVWKINWFLVWGSEDIRVSFDNAIGTALGQITVRVPRRLWREFDKEELPVFTASWRRALHHFFGGIAGPRGVLDRMLGMIREERTHSDYEVREIINRERAAWITEVGAGNAAPIDETEASPLAELDLRLWDAELMETVTPLVQAAEAWADRRWSEIRVRVREEIEAGLPEVGEAERQQLLVDALEERRQRIFLEEIQSSEELRQVQGGDIRDLLISRALALRVLLKHEKEYARWLSETRRRIRDDLQARHPIRSRIKDWLEEKQEEELRKAIDRRSPFYAERRREIESRIRADHPGKSLIPGWLSAKVEAEMEYFRRGHFDIYGDVIAELRGAGLEQEAILMERDVEYLVDQAPAQIRALTQERRAERTYPHSYQRWNPADWPEKQRGPEEEDDYWTSVEYNRHEVSSATPGWRLQNLWHRGASWTWNLMYTMKEAIWNGPVGLRALVSGEPFPYRHVVDEETGAVSLDTDHPRATLASRWRRIGERADERRTEFEESRGSWGPFASLEGPWFAVSNTAYRYLGRGLLGLWHVGGAAITTVGGGALAATSPVWMLGASMARSGFNALLYDTDSPDKKKLHRIVPLVHPVLVRACILAPAEAALATLGLVAHGTAATAISVFSPILAEVRYLADSAVLEFMKASARRGHGGSVPTTDKVPFLWELEEGPGVASTYYWQIPEELALLFIYVDMRLAEISALVKSARSTLGEPLEAYQEATAHLDRLYGLERSAHRSAINANHAEASRELERERARAVVELEQINSTNRGGKGWVKLSTATLTSVLQTGAAAAEQFYTERVFPHMSSQQIAAFWRNLETVPEAEDRWISVARRHLANQLGSQVLEPLEETELSRVTEIPDLEEVVAGITSEIFDGEPPADRVRIPSELHATPTVPYQNTGAICERTLINAGRAFAGAL